MPRLEKSKLLPYTPTQLCDLVLDVAHYPEFLPWCREAHVEQDDPRAGKMQATLEIGYKDFRAAYTSMITYERPHQVLVTQAKGPLAHLHNQWRFDPHPRGCRLYFEIDFAFQMGLLNTLIQPIFTKAATEMVEAFEARAACLYRV